MNRFIKFMAVGLIFAVFPGEISNQLLIRRSPAGFAITLLNYVWFLALGFWVGGLIDRRLKSRLAARLTYFFLYGFVGLMIEWFVLHVYTLQPSPVQLMMFTFWAGMMLTPRIFVDEPASAGLDAIRRGIRRYMVIWSAISLLPFAIAGVLARNHLAGPRNFSILAFGVGALGLNYYFYRYFKCLKLPTSTSG
jgi:hypothetical protein